MAIGPVEYKPFADFRPFGASNQTIVAAASSNNITAMKC